MADAHKKRSDIGPADFGVPAEFAERARNYARWCEEKAAEARPAATDRVYTCPTCRGKGLLGKDEIFGSAWTETTQQVGTVRISQPPEYQDARFVCTRLVLIDYTGSLPVGNYVLYAHPAPSHPDRAVMQQALETIIALNVRYAIDRYGDASQAESMECVRVARTALSASLGQVSEPRDG